MSIYTKQVTGVSMKSFSRLGTIDHPEEVISMVASLKKFESSDVAKERLRIIVFYETYGEAATREAFEVDRKLIYIWRQRYKKSRGKLSSLVPISTKPCHTRTPNTHPKVVAYIKGLRKKYPRLGKEKIYPLLCVYCKKEHLPVVSQATIGREIARHNMFYAGNSGKVYHNPASGHAQKRRGKRKRLKYAPKYQDLGHIQMDTVVRFVDGARIYFYTAIDARGKFGISLPYTTLNSQNTLDFYKKFMLTYPVKIKDVQTDNGLEFQGTFDDYLTNHSIPHLFSYPRCPKINGVVERFNRTLQEEFVDHYLFLLTTPREFSGELANYLLFYNTRRIHKSLDNTTPLEYLLSQGMSNMSQSYTTTGHFLRFMVQSCPQWQTPTERNVITPMIWVTSWVFTL